MIEWTLMEKITVNLTVKWRRLDKNIVNQSENGNGYGWDNYNDY